MYFFEAFIVRVPGCLLVVCLCILATGCKERNGTLYMGGGSGADTQRNIAGAWGEGTEVYRKIHFAADGTATITFNGTNGPFEVPAEYKCLDVGLLEIKYLATDEQRRQYAEAVRVLPSAQVRNAGRTANPPFVYALADLPPELPKVAQYEIDLPGQKYYNERLRVCTTDRADMRQELFSLKRLRQKTDGAKQQKN
jgi:hypothetical protein